MSNTYWVHIVKSGGYWGSKYELHGVFSDRKLAEKYIHDRIESGYSGVALEIETFPLNPVIQKKAIDPPAQLQ